MADAPVSDLLALDRDVSRGCRALARWRAAMARDAEAYADEDPLDEVRRVAGKSTWDALSQLAPSAANAPLRDALKRWVSYLTQARILRPQDVAWARAASDRRLIFAGDTERRVSWRESWRGVVSAPTAAEVSLWLQAAAEAGPALAEVSRVRATRRVEVARRFGVEHPWAAVVEIHPGAVRDAAIRLLDQTDDLSHAVWREAATSSGGAATILHAALAREAGEGWPARLTPHWIAGVFGPGLQGLDIDLPPLPELHGAASFARALYLFGAAVRGAVTPRSVPFALSEDPGRGGAHRFGFVFAALAADAEWQRRVLCVGRRVALAQSRMLARTAFFEARLHAARLILGDDAEFAAQDRFDEIGARLFGRALDPRLRGAWPSAREDEPARFTALLQARAFLESLREGFDCDWYRNPRAWSHLRSLGEAPAHEPIDAGVLDAQVDALARAFEGALG